MRKIGILGGSFDPIHFGHLHIAHEICVKKNLDQIWFVPANISPFKMNDAPIECYHRIKMLELATKDNAAYKVVDIECRYASPSYTIDTVKRLKKKYPEDHFYLILGLDISLNLQNWKLPLELIQEIDLIVATRSLDVDLESMISNPKLLEAVKKNFVKIPEKQISSTEIRTLLKEGRSPEGLVPKNVLKYILDNHLYSDD